MNITFGGIYTENGNIRTFLSTYCNGLNDQKQHYWFPIRVVKGDEDNIYMIDTYQFEMPYECKGDYSKMIEYLKSMGNPEDNTWVKNKAYDYYYSAVVKITECSIKAFELVADLSDYVVISDEEARYYNDDDVVRGVMFWNYHRSGRGVNIKRKTAKLNYNLKIDNLYYDVLNSVKSPDISDYDVNKLVECKLEAIKNEAIYDEKKVEYILNIQTYLHKAYKNYRKYIAKLRESENK